jgi:hypothetical protein
MPMYANIWILHTGAAYPITKEVAFAVAPPVSLCICMVASVLCYEARREHLELEGRVYLLVKERRALQWLGADFGGGGRVVA